MSKTLLFYLTCAMLLTVTVNVRADLVAHWSLDEGSGNVAIDSTGNGHDGALINGPEWTEGVYGMGLQFGGSPAKVDVPYSEDLNPADTFTLSLWANPDPAGSDYRSPLTSRDKIPGATGYMIYVTPANTWHYWVSNDNWTETQGPAAQFGEWTHVAATYDNGANKLYLNGQLVAESQGTISPNTRRPTRIGAGSTESAGNYYFVGIIDDVAIFNHAMTQAEIQIAMQGIIRPTGLAVNPDPADGKDDIDRDGILNWSPSKFAEKHDVYFDTNFNDVNNASRTNPLDVLVSQAQVLNSYDPGRLQFKTTYYWRIDEVNAAPDNTIFKGNIWSFTVEPVAYPIQNVVVTASSTSAGADANNTINGLGLTDDLHSNKPEHMWLSDVAPGGVSIQYEFDKAYKLHDLWGWNHNTEFEMILGYGAKNVTIETSTDANNWTALGDFEFAKADGTNAYAHNTTINLEGVMAQYVRLNIKSNWGGIVPQYGLSEVRFYYTPLRARYPVPADGKADIGLDVALDWRTGREAAQHKVYLDTNEQAVTDGSDAVLIATVDDSEYTVNALELGKTYYWKIDEVNEAETTATRQGEVWNFSTQEYLVVDDFDSYNDIPVGEDGSNLVYMTWADGFENTANGSTIGYFVPFQPTMETSIVHDGKQSVPLYYDNTVAGQSEATAKIADLAIGQDWSKSGIKSLSLWFYGDPNNAAEQMYVKINGAKVLYDGDAANLASTAWQTWNIELADFGVNLGSVTELSIGFERTGATGGTGMVLLDALRLYSYDRQLITPAEPDTASLVGHWKFDEGSGTTALDSSGNNNNGAITGAEWVAGKIGGALNFKGAEYVVIPPASWSSIEKQVTVAFWAYGDPAVQPQADVCFAAYQGTDTRVAQCHVPWSSGTVYWDTGGDATGYDRISKSATATEYEGSWQHWAFVKNADTGVQSIYLNGVLWHSGTDNTRAMTGVTVFTIGSGADLTENYAGMIDDFRLYDSALSQEELAWLAGRTKPYDKPF